MKQILICEQPIFCWTLSRMSSNRDFGAGNVFVYLNGRYCFMNSTKPDDFLLLSDFP